MNEIKYKGTYLPEEILDLGKLTIKEANDILSSPVKQKLLILPYNEQFMITKEIVNNILNVQELIWPQAANIPKGIFEFTNIEYLSIGSCAAIRPYAFESARIKYVNIESCPRIQVAAFRFSELEEIILPADIEKIASRAFYRCLSLKNVDMTKVKNKVSISSECFKFTSSLEKFDFSKINSIEMSVFSNSGIQDAIFSSPIKIKSDAFAFSKLRFVEFNHKDITFIGDSQFSNCTQLSEVKFNGYKNKIPCRCFYSCNNLKKVTGVQNITAIGQRAFCYADLSGLEEMPNLKCIKEEAFSSSGIEEITVYASEIECNVFFDCYNFKKITFNSTINSLPSEAFKSCVKLEYADLEKTKIGEIPSYCFAKTALKEIKFPKNITAIRFGAFSETKIKDISIPDTVVDVGLYAFSYCHNLTSVRWSEKCLEIRNYVFTKCKKLTTLTNTLNIKKIGHKSLAYTKVNATFKELQAFEQDSFLDCSGQIDLRQTAIFSYPEKQLGENILLPYYCN